MRLGNDIKLEEMKTFCIFFYKSDNYILMNRNFSTGFRGISFIYIYYLLAIYEKQN